MPTAPVILPVDAMPTRSAADNVRCRARPFEVVLGASGVGHFLDRPTKCKPFRGPA
jgi:hypothetical protein